MKPAVFATLVALALPLVATPAFALECPLPHPEAGADAIKETPARIKDIGATLVTNDAANGVDQVLDDLRARHPHARKAEIANFLVSAYCPALAAKGYSGSIAKAKMRDFAILVDQRLYGHHPGSFK